MCDARSQMLMFFYLFSDLIRHRAGPRDRAERERKVEAYIERFLEMMIH